MPREDRRQPNPRPEADLFHDKLRFLRVAVGMMHGQIEETRGRLTHLAPEDRTAIDELYDAGKTVGEFGADTDLVVAMNELNFTPDLKNTILAGVNRARTQRKGNPPTPPSGQ